MLAHLNAYFGEKIILLNFGASAPIVGFRKFVAKTLKLVKQSLVSNADGGVERVARRVVYKSEAIHFTWKTFGMRKRSETQS